MRRIKRLDPNAPTGQGELFDCWRYFTVFTDSPFILEQAEAQHRGHAIIEQINADLIDGRRGMIIWVRLPEYVCCLDHDPLARESRWLEMARPAGVEPATFGSVDQRSIQLSYGRTPVRLLGQIRSPDKSAIPGSCRRGGNPEADGEVSGAGALAVTARQRDPEQDEPGNGDRHPEPFVSRERYVRDARDHQREDPDAPCCGRLDER